MLWGPGGLQVQIVFERLLLLPVLYSWSFWRREERASSRGETVGPTKVEMEMKAAQNKAAAEKREEKQKMKKKFTEQWTQITRKRESVGEAEAIRGGNEIT